MKPTEDDKQKFEIPPLGNLGLLALGYRGVVAWRKVRDPSRGPGSSATKP